MTDARSFDQAQQEIIRIQAVKAIKTGKSHKDVADIAGVSLRAVGKWWKTYQELGFSGLRRRSRRPKSAENSGKLKGWQCSSLVRTILRKTPD